jgi:hypothetical protein
VEVARLALAVAQMHALHAKHGGGRRLADARMCGCTASRQLQHALAIGAPA